MTERLRLEILRAAFGGDGISSYQGKTCFVEGALPGEEVEAQVLQDKKDFLRLRTVKILQSSPDRLAPPCSYYGRCGGCQYQHVSYEQELHFKEFQIRDVLKKIAGVETNILPMIAGAQEYHYGNSVTFHVGPQEKNKAPQLCFVSKDNVSLIPVKSCHLLKESLQAVLERPVRSKPGTDKIGFKLDEKN